MPLKHHLFLSSFFLTVCSVIWGLAEIVTIFSSSEFANTSYLTYLTILAFPLVLYGLAGLLIGSAVAILISPVVARKRETFTIRKGFILYGLLYFAPLLFGIEYILNRRFLPTIPFTNPVSLLYSFLALLIVLAAAYTSSKVIPSFIRGGVSPLRPLVVAILTGVIIVLYLILSPEVQETRVTGSGAADPQKPNVLLITIDTLRADYLGCYGNRSGLTPVIDSLSASGTTFRKATSQVPLTLPSHTSILTSTYPPVHGVRDNAVYRFGNALPTLAEVLHESGYLTAAFISAFVLDSRFGLDRGFEIYNDEIQNQAYFYFSSASPPFALAVGLKLLGLAPRNKPERKADKTTEAIIEWLEENRERPFFLWAHYFDPHGPLNPPSPYDTLFLPPDTDPHEFRKEMERFSSLLGQFDSRLLTQEAIDGIRTLYGGEVAFTDHQIGVLMKRLEELGLAERTLVVITADHGQSIAEHDYLGHAMELYQEIMHVPLIFHFPPVIPAGKTVDNRVQSIDIMPTILDFLDISAPETCNGRSLLPLIGEKSIGSEDPWAYLETFHPKPKKKRLIGIISGDYKYVRAIDGDREALFRIGSDPEENMNLAVRDPERTNEMRGKLQHLLEGMEDYASSHQIPLDPQTREAMRALGYIR